MKDKNINSLAHVCTVHCLTWASAGGCRGCECSPLEFENDDAICCSPVKYLKFFARAFGARNNYTKTKFKMSKNHLKFLFFFCPQCEKSTIFQPWLALTAFNFVLSAKHFLKLTVFSFLCENEKKLVFVLPPGKFPGDAHAVLYTTVFCKSKKNPRLIFTHMKTVIAY